MAYVMAYQRRRNVYQYRVICSMCVIIYGIMWQPSTPASAAASIKQRRPSKKTWRHGGVALNEATAAVSCNGVCNGVSYQWRMLRMQLMAYRRVASYGNVVYRNGGNNQYGVWQYVP